MSMRFLRYGIPVILTRFLIIICVLSMAFVPGLLVDNAQAAATTFAANSLIIPMDATYQNYGMFKAYGLVYKLLSSGIPVQWAIASGKTFNGVDFTATTIDDRTSAANGSPNYTGGPFIIDGASAAAAQPIITAWWAANGNQPVVHKATADFTANIDISLRSAPRFALESTNSSIAIAYFQAAGIPDGNGNNWSSASPNILNQTMIACNNPSSCTGDTVVGNGALFANGPCSPRKYDTFITPHNSGYSYSLTDITNLGTQTYAELDFFTFKGGGWTALCHSILSNENNINALTRNGSPSVKALFESSKPGGMLTQNGFPSIANLGGVWTVNKPGLPLAQAVVTTAATQGLPGGSVQTWHAPDGTINNVQYWNATERVAFFKNTSGVEYDWAVNGTHHDGSGAGKITFLGGHSYSTSVPYSANFEAPYLRFFYNSLFFNGAAVAKLSLSTTPTSAPQGNTNPLTIKLTNTGSSTAMQVQPVVITLASGISYVSTTGIQPDSVVAGGGGTTILTYTIPGGTVVAGFNPITVNATVFSATTGTFKAASLSVQYGDVFGEKFTSQDCTSVTITPTPSALITKTPATQGPLTIGGFATWTLAYRNPGSVGLQNPYIEDILPPSLSYASASPTPTYVIPVAGGTKLRWVLTSPLAAGGSGSITLRAIVQTANGQPFTNNVSFAGTDSSGNIYSSSASATVSVNLPKATISKSVSPSGAVATGTTLTYTISPNSPGPTSFNGLRFFDSPPTNTTYQSVTQGGSFGAYPRLAAINGDDVGPGPSTLMSINAGTTPFTYALDASVTVTMTLTNRDPITGGFDITGVTPSALIPNDGASTCTGPSPASATVAKNNGTATFTYTCTIASLGELTWDGNARGTYNGSSYEFSTATSSSVLGVPTTTGSNVVSWRPITNTNTPAAPSSAFAAGTGAGLFAFNGSTALWERYDILGNTWITSPNNLPAATADGAALVYDGGGYANGYVYGLRGGSTTFWRYKLSNGTTGTWAAVPPAAAPFTIGAGGALTKLGNYIYALQGGTTTGFARYDITTNTWTTLTGVTQAVAAGGALTTDGTYIYAFVGNNKKVFYRYNPTAGTWATMANPPWAVKQGGSLVSIGGTIYALRGNNSNAFAKFVPNATTGKWTSLQNAPASINAGGTLSSDGTYLYATRGGAKTAFYRYNPAANTWIVMASTLANITTGGALTWIPGSSGATNTNSLSAPSLVTGSSVSPATIIVTQTLTSSTAVSGITPTPMSDTGSTNAGTPSCTASPTGAQSIAAGGTLIYTWTCTNVYGNGGNNIANNLGNLIFSAGATATTPGTTWSSASSNSVLVTPPLTFTATVNSTPTTFSQVTNQAIMADNLAYKPGIGSNSVVTPILRSPNLVVTKSVVPASGTQVSPGNTLTYTLLVQNTTSGPTTTASVTDNVPTDTTYVAASCSTTLGSCAQSAGTVTYTLGVIPAYGMATLTYQVTANTPAAAGLSTITNMANASYTSPLCSPSPCTASSNTVTNPLLTIPAVTISKAESVSPAADDNGRITPGSTITYTMIVNNPQGAVPATSVVAKDPVPEGTTYVPASCTTTQGSCDQAAATVTYTIGSMAADATVTLTFQVTVNSPAMDGDTITNGSSVSAETNIVGSPYTANSNLVSYQVDAAPIIGIVKSASPASGSIVNTGDTITYTLVVSNTGNANTVSAYVNDVIPTNTTYVPNSTTVNGLPVTEITPGVAPVTGNMKVYSPGYADPDGDGGTLVVGSPATVTFQVTVTSPTGIATTITNSATTGSASTTEVTSNTTTHTTPANADLSITKTDGVTSVPTGALTTYTIVVSNAGSSAANGAIFTDPAVSNLSVTGLTCGTATGGAACPTVENTTVALMQGTGIVIPTLPSGGSVTFSVTATAGTSEPFNIVNVATIAPPEGTIDPNTGDNSATDTDMITVTQINVAKSSTTTEITVAGQVVPYSFTITNTGNVSLSGMTVNDPKCDAAPALLSGDANTDSILQTTETWIYTCTHTVTQAEIDAGGILSNTVTVDSAESIPATDTYFIPVTQTPAINVAKSSTTTSITTAGQEVPYKFTVTNNGNVTLTGITVSDPNCTTSISGPSGDSNSDTKLQVTETWIYTCSHTVTQAEIDAGGILSNTVTVDSAESIPATDTYFIPVTQTPSIHVVKSSTTTEITVAGQVVPYSFVVTNTGNVTLTVITVSDPICDATPVLSGDTNIDSQLQTTETWTYTCTHTVTQAEMDAATGIEPQLHNEVTVDSNETEPVNDTKDIPITQTPAMEVTKVADVSTYVLGDTITYTITVKNTGNVSISDLVVSDPKASTGPTYSSGDTNSNLILDVGETWTYTATHVITQADMDAGSFANTATGSGKDPKDGPVTDTGDETVTTTQTPALTLDKTTTATAYAAVGDVIPYSYELKNSGNVTLYAPFTVADNKATVTCPATPNSLAPLETLTCTATYTVTQADLDAGSLTNIATGTAKDKAVNGNDVTSNEDRVTVTGTQSPALSIVKSVTNPVAPGTLNHVGQVLTYSYLLTNTGNVTLTSPFTVSDDKSTDESCPATPSSLAPLGTLTCTATYTVTQADLNAGSVTNVASAQGFFGETPVDSSTDTETVGAAQSPALSIVKSVTNPVAPGTLNHVGQVITYSYLLTNTGNVTLTSPFTVSDDKSTDESCPATSSSLAPLGTLTCTATYTVTQADLNAGSVTNVASAQGFFGETPVNSSTDTETVGAAQNPDLSIIKTDSVTTYGAGKTITYTVTVKNVGNVDVPGAIVVDAKPANILNWAWTCRSQNGGATGCIPVSSGTSDFSQTVNLPVGASIVYTVTASTIVNPTGNLVNTAKVILPKGYTDPTPSNNTSTDIDTLEAKPLSLPNTGFAANRVTILPEQTILYADLGEIWLEIPRFEVSAPILGAPLKDGEWDLTWLANQVGWLEGTAYPTLTGNSALTAHVYDANGLPGPFNRLGSLVWGDQIIVHNGKLQYIYAVRTVEQILPTDSSILGHEDRAWLTLITCKGYNEKTQSYQMRIAVKAVLLKVEDNK
jgi:LPXTG-site transpeptidase (sortase) family protein